MSKKKKKKKCGFVDCKNPAQKKEDICESCENRKENKTCHACSQPEPESNQTLTFQINKAIIWKNSYRIAEKLKDLVPSEFRSKFDQILPKLKLSSNEQKLVEKTEKLINDCLTAKGGKQWNIFYWKICSTCNSEINPKIDEFTENNPGLKSLKDRMDETENELDEIFQKLDRNQRDKLREKMSEIEAEIFGAAEENDSPNEPNKDKPDQPNSKKCATCEKDLTDQSTTYSSQGKNYCSQICQDKGTGKDISNELTQLKQEINSLKQEIRDLKNPHNPTPTDPNTLTQKEKELEDKENQLDKLERKDKNKDQSKGQNKNNDSNLDLYIGLGITGAIIVFLLAVFWWKNPAILNSKNIFLGYWLSLKTK